MRFLALALLLAGTPALAQSTPAPAPTPAPPTSATPDPDQEIRCRRIEVTGSLARRERVCKTVAEWRRLGQAGNDTARDIVDASRGRPSGQ